MLESFEINSSSDKYSITLGCGLLSGVVTKYPDAVYIVDDFFIGSMSFPTKRVIFIHADEQTKSLERIPEVIVKLRELGVNRSTRLVAVGGGVVQDIATFVASIYMRGLPWVYLPTTILSMADSCIGGKSSINVGGIKNLVGNFYPPAEILIDVEFSVTLSAEQIIGGLFEAEKICFARGSGYYSDYLACKPRKGIDLESLHKLISLSLKAKKWFIEIDEFDKKERLLLNFGHTFGHAIEAATDFQVSHGIAVGVGMLIAVRFCKLVGLVNDKSLELLDSFSSHLALMLRSVDDLVVPEIPIETCLGKFESDKKHLATAYRIVCPTGDGKLELVSVPKSVESINIVRDAYREGLAVIGWNYSG